MLVLDWFRLWFLCFRLVFLLRFELFIVSLCFSNRPKPGKSSTKMKFFTQKPKNFVFLSFFRLNSDFRAGFLKSLQPSGTRTLNQNPTYTALRWLTFLWWLWYDQFSLFRVYRIFENVDFIKLEDSQIDFNGQSKLLPTLNPVWNHIHLFVKTSFN